MGFSVGRVVSDVVSEVSGKLDDIARAVVIPLILVAVLNLAYYFEFVAAPIGFLLNLVGLVIYAIMAVSCHRLVLLGRGSLPSAWGMYFSSSVIHYAVWIFLLSIAATLVALPLMLFVMPIASVFSAGDDASNTALYALSMFVVGVPVTYLVARCALILPARAIDNDRSMTDTWELSNGCSIRVWLVLVVPYVLVMSVVMLIMVATVSWMPLGGQAVLEFLLAPVTVLQVILLSCTYKQLVELRPERSGNRDANGEAITP